MFSFVNLCALRGYRSTDCSNKLLPQGTLDSAENAKKNQADKARESKFANLLLAVRRSSGGQFAQSREETGRRPGIVESIESDGGGELWRLGAEADLQHVLLANGHQSVELRSCILFPMSARGEDDGAGLVDFPFPLRTLGGTDAVAMSTPAMPHDFEMETGRAAKIGFECERFFLLAHAVQNPVHGQRPRPEFHRDVGIFKTAGREVQASTQAVTVKPARIEDASFSGTRGLDPAESLRTSAAIVRGE